nr:energy transducer TonB [Mucilaginibacter rivuli]
MQNPAPKAPPKPKIRPVSTIPEFPGGDDAFGKYLGANIVYPANARKAKVEGIVLIAFVINNDGIVGQTRIINSPSADLSEEAVRVIKASPKWKPATENGKPVEGTRTIPINFKLQNN